MIAPAGYPIEGAIRIVRDRTHTPASIHGHFYGCLLRPPRPSVDDPRDRTGGLLRDSQRTTLTGRPIGSIAVNRRAVVGEREDTARDAEMDEHEWSRGRRLIVAFA